MSAAQSIANQMEELEKKLLEDRTRSLKIYSSYAPLLIVFVALVSIITALFFYGKIIADYKQRAKLQEELINKDADIQKRLSLIQGIADKISNGNYKIRLAEEAKDTLGTLSGSLNKMGESLDYSFNLLNDKEWLQAGVVELNVRMLGEQNVNSLAENILKYAVEYTGSDVGALYTSNENDLVLTSTYALSEISAKRVQTEEGVVGQCVRNKKMIRLENISDDDFIMSTTAGNIRPSSLIVIPIHMRKPLKG